MAEAAWEWGEERYKPVTISTVGL